MKKLYFVRHGESEANKKELFAGRWDVTLTDLGRAQAKMAAKQVARIKVDRIVSSPLLRAKETAEIIAQEIGYPKNEILLCDLFVERDYGELTQKTWKNAAKIDFENVAGIESGASLEKRAGQAAQLLQNLKEDTIVLVGHGTSGRAVRDQLLKHSGDIEVPIEEEILNAQIVRWI